jgi:hypothetical protein
VAKPCCYLERAGEEAELASGVESCLSILSHLALSIFPWVSSAGGMVALSATGVWGDKNKAIPLEVARPGRLSGSCLCT